jgi:isoprenylcysteine carboxyl methyltransferase (ICMT) family protein YpbQ
LGRQSAQFALIPCLLCARYEIGFYYSLQIGWYLHGVYTHFFLDTKKSDFAVMIVHHVVTLTLLYGAYVVGYTTAVCCIWLMTIRLHQDSALTLTLPPSP